MAQELTAIWQEDLAAYLKREELDWPTRLSQLRDMQTRQGLRPGRIQFTTLAAGGDPDRADAWDVTGLLLGRQVIGERDWYVFIVGIVEREDFRPVEIHDIRLMAFTAGGDEPIWREGAPNAESLRGYKEAHKLNIPIRFPADDDGYELEVDENRVTVREVDSGGEWTLLLAEKPGST
jgi:hypothetical protein